MIDFIIQNKHSIELRKQFLRDIRFFDIQPYNDKASQ